MVAQPSKWKYCAWFFHLVTLGGSVLMLPVLHLFAVTCGETNLNLIATVHGCTFYSWFRSVRIAVKETRGQPGKFYTVVESMPRIDAL